jgi:hypothetical protein
MEQNYMDYYKLVDTSPNGYGRSYVSNSNNWWLTLTTLKNCAFGTVGSSCGTTEGTETTSFRNLPLSSETGRNYKFLSATDDFFIELWAYATNSNPIYAYFPYCDSPPCYLYANTTTSVKMMNYSDNSTGNITSMTYRNHTAAKWHFLNYDVRYD